MTWRSDLRASNSQLYGKTAKILDIFALRISILPVVFHILVVHRSRQFYWEHHRHLRVRLSAGLHALPANCTDRLLPAKVDNLLAAASFPADILQRPNAGADLQIHPNLHPRPHAHTDIRQRADPDANLPSGGSSSFLQLLTAGHACPYIHASTNIHTSAHIHARAYLHPSTYPHANPGIHSHTPAIFAVGE